MRGVHVEYIDVSRSEFNKKHMYHIMINSMARERNDALHPGYGMPYFHASRTGHASSPSTSSMKHAKDVCRYGWLRVDTSEGHPRRLVLIDARRFVARRRRRMDDVGRVLRRPCRASRVRGADVARHWAWSGAAGSARPRLLAAAAGNGHAVIFCRKGIKRRSTASVPPCG